MKRRACSIVFVILAEASGAFAQGVQTATLEGTVTSMDRRPLAGVAVHATSPALIGEREAITSAAGDYVLRGLPPGAYTIRFSVEGMENAQRRVTLAVGMVSRADAQMSAGVLRETMTVNAGSRTMLENTAVGQNFRNDVVQRLPVTRGPVAIASLAGAVTDRTPGSGQLSINGGMAYDNNFLINGITFQDNIVGSIHQLFIPDAIEETQVLTSGISAEYGHFTGGVLNVITKSGGNESSGSVRDNLSKPSWLALTPYEKGYRGEGVPRAKPIEHTGGLSHVLELTVGGPIVRDALWFFAAGRNENSTATRTLNVTGETFNVQQKNRRPELKFTAAVSSTNTLQASYIDNPVRMSHSLQMNPLELAAVALDGETSNRAWTAYDTAVLTSRTFVEARLSQKTFGFRHMGGSATDIADSPMRTSLGLPPNVFGTYNAPYFDNADSEHRNNAQASTAVSYFLSRPSWGSHDFKAGYERFIDSFIGGNSQSATSYVFSTRYKVSGGAPIYDSAGRLIPLFSPMSAGADTATYISWIVATRGARLDTTTDSLFVNDRWNLNTHFSFQIGVRYEHATTKSTGGIIGVDTSNIVPRLAASYDPLGDARLKFDATYAQYAGRYDTALVNGNSPAGHPSGLAGYYIGPPGEGRSFAPGFDPANYVFYYASVPTANVFMGGGLHAPVNHEWTLSTGAAFPRSSSLKATVIKRSVKQFIEDFVTIDQGCTEIVFHGVDAGCVDNVRIRNSSVPKREYEAVELQLESKPGSSWDLGGNWTHQIRNGGDYEGEAGQGIFMSLYGDRPEIQSPRELPNGRLAQFEADRVRVWTTYGLDMKTAGNLTAAVLYRFDSPMTFSYVSNVARSPISTSRNPGYKNVSPLVALFFGDRGIGEFHSTSLFDVSLQYSLPFPKRVTPWLKIDVLNVFDDDTQIAWNTTIVPDSTSPKDDMGYPTAYKKTAAFGRPIGTSSYVRPREYRAYAGIRF